MGVSFSGYGRLDGTVAYITRMTMAKSPFACWQYGISDFTAATLQLFVRYHGGPGWGCLGSDMSLPDCQRAEMTKSTKVAK